MAEWLKNYNKGLQPTPWSGPILHPCHFQKLRSTTEIQVVRPSSRISYFVRTSTEGAELADGVAGVTGWPFAIDMDDDPGLVSSDTIRWFRNLLAFEDASDKP